MIGISQDTIESLKWISQKMWNTTRLINTMDWEETRNKDLQNKIIDAIKNGKNISKIRQEWNIQFDHHNKQVIINKITGPLDLIVQSIYKDYNAIFDQCDLVKIGMDYGQRKWCIWSCEIKNSNIKTINTRNTSIKIDKNSTIESALIINAKTTEIEWKIQERITYNPRKDSEKLTIKSQTYTEEIIIEPEPTHHTSSNTDRRTPAEKLIIHIEWFNNNIYIRDIEANAINISNYTGSAKQINIENIKTHTLKIQQNSKDIEKHATVSLKNIERRDQSTLEIWSWITEMHIENTHLTNIWNILFKNLKIKKSSIIYDQIPWNIRSNTEQKDGERIYTRHNKATYSFFNQLYTVAKSNNNMDDIAHYYQTAQEALLKTKQPSDPDRRSLQLSKKRSAFWTNRVRSLLLMLFFSILLYWVVIITSKERQRTRHIERWFIWSLREDVFIWINPIHKTNQIGHWWKIESLDLLNRIVLSFGIYETIRSFRKYHRK